MISKFKKVKEYIPPLLIVSVIIVSFALGIHNATLYNPNHGFDGEAHLFYINYIAQNKKLPSADISWSETHQSPIYYIIGAGLKILTGDIKTVQYINIFVLWLIIIMVGAALRKVFKNKHKVLIGMFSLAAMPMLNIFPAMVTNELLNTFWIVSVSTGSIFLVLSKKIKQIVNCSLWIALSLILGYWTKVSVILIVPTVVIVYLYLFFRSKFNKRIIFATALIFSITVIFFCLPVFNRAKNSTNPSSNIIRPIFVKPGRSLDFYFRLDWIVKADMYNTQYYSLLGGAWNSFLTDGHNAITPFVKFHKKSFILWSLGFILLPISLYGLKLILKKEKKIWLILTLIGVEMLVVYAYYNLNSHYSAARLTYEMGIVVPYAFGIASASENKKLKLPILFLLLIQFFIMVSFFWIQPWWHVTK